MRIRKFVCTMALAAVTCVSLSGCYGSNALFNKMHQFNGSIGDKWLNTVVHFVATFVLPVYPICLFADYVIFNTIEFWTGSNLIAMGDTYEQIDGNGNKIFAVRNADGTLSVNMVDVNGGRADFILERDGDVIRAVDVKGDVIAVSVINAKGVVAQYAAGQ